MRTGKTLALLLVSLVLAISTSSCMVLVPANKAQHKGWFKNSNNPHNPRHRQTIKAFKSNSGSQVVIKQETHKDKKKGKNKRKNKKHSV